jgi:hypothetical protein
MLGQLSDRKQLQDHVTEDPLRAGFQNSRGAWHEQVLKGVDKAFLSGIAEVP